MRKFLYISGANEGIGFTFLFDGCRKGDLTGITQALNFSEPLGNRFIVRLGMCRIARVGERIFVSALKPGDVGKARQPLQ